MYGSKGITGIVVAGAAMLPQTNSVSNPIIMYIGIVLITAVVVLRIYTTFKKHQSNKR